MYTLSKHLLRVCLCKGEYFPWNIYIFLENILKKKINFLVCDKYGKNINSKVFICNLVKILEEGGIGASGVTGK